MIIRYIVIIYLSTGFDGDAASQGNHNSYYKD